MEGSSVVCVTGLEIVLRNVHWHRAEHEALETPVQEDKDCVGGLALRGLRGHGCFKLGPLGRSPFTSFGSHDGSPRWGYAPSSSRSRRSWIASSGVEPQP